jgi:hypothetical protein
MGRFYGEVGYSETVETTPGCWTPQITEKMYTGDVVKLSRRMVGSGGSNDNIQVNHEISIVADPFAYDNFLQIVYVKWSGVYWKVTNVTVSRPRLILSLGGVYNGDEA